MEKENKTTESKTEEKNENKEERTKDKKAEIKKIIIKRDSAVVNGKNLPVSTKHAIAICNFIRKKNVDNAISELEKVQTKRIAIPMSGEIPHKKGKGMMSGRYPIKAAKEFIILLKSLKANAVVNELELEECKIECMANVASRPYRRFGQSRFKRTNVQIKLAKLEKKSKKTKEKK